MGGDVTELRPRLRQRVLRELHDFRLCGYFEMEVTEDDGTVVVQFPEWPDVSFIRNQGAEFLKRRGFHVHLRDFLSVVISEGCR